MKFITLTAVALLGMFAAKPASAQCAYDAIVNATVATYYTGPGYECAGDVMRITPSNATFSTVDLVFVATAAGTYSFNLHYYNNLTPSPIAPPLPPLPVMFCSGAGAVWTVNTSVTIPPIIGPTVFIVTVPVPCTTIGPIDQGLAVSMLGSPGLYLAYDDSPAVPLGSDYDGFTVDLNQNGVLEYSSIEWFTFDPAWLNANALIALCTPCIPSDSLLQPQAASVRRLDRDIKIQERKLPASANSKL